jgi:hypothetical protein
MSTTVGGNGRESRPRKGRIVVVEPTLERRGVRFSNGDESRNVQSAVTDETPTAQNRLEQVPGGWLQTNGVEIYRS